MLTTRKSVLVIPACLVLLQTGSAVALEEDKPRKDFAAPGIAVVELFTSQGCSSCPPADAHLKRLANIARAKHLAIFLLSFHVDYWNRLGWNDPFSAPET